MLTKKYNFLNKQYFREDNFKDDLAALMEFYISEGFLEAIIENYQITIDSTLKQIEIEIEIEEGEVTTISGIW